MDIMGSIIPNRMLNSAAGKSSNIITPGDAKIGRYPMNKLDCTSEKLSSRALGVLLVPLALLLAFAGSLVLPVVGLFFAVPLLLMSGVLLLAPESKACRLIRGKSA